MRKINEIIIHCSATYPNQDVTVDDIREWHLQRGFNDIGYHYVIYPDGSVHVGRPIEKVGAHCSGHNNNSIGICYIGGLDENGSACDTRTFEQKQSLIAVIQILSFTYPIVKVTGHNQYSNKACPCFDVSKEYGINPYNNF